MTEMEKNGKEYWDCLSTVDLEHDIMGQIVQDIHGLSYTGYERIAHIIRNILKSDKYIVLKLKVKKIENEEYGI